MTERIRVLLADEQSLFREAVRAVLQSEADLDVIAEARDGVQAVAEAKRVQPDVAVLDANLPNCDGIRATKLITESLESCRVLVLGVDGDIRQMVEALEAGARGFLTKEIPLAELIEAARSLFRGETLIPPGMLGPLLAHLINRHREEEEARRRVSRLTKREREVLALLASGGDNDTIAQRLVISPETARTHVQNVLGKLGVHSRLEAAAFVLQTGMMADLVEANA
ncbi:MAG TPA: response regulator transcription factor [Actinomycetota bacterium]|jgi:DNA-binding NarL/FixJ family response regulator